MWLYIFTFLIAPIGYIIKVILSHDLSVSDIGSIYSIISLIVLLTGYADLGMAESMNYFLPKYAVNKQYQDMKYILLLTLIVHLVSGLILGWAIYFGANWLAMHQFTNFDPTLMIPLIQVASLFFIGSSMLHYTTQIFSALQYVKLQKITEIIRMLVTLSAVCIILFSGLWSAVFYMWCWIIGVITGSLVWLIFTIIFVYRPYLQDVSYAIDTETKKSFIRYSLATFLTVNVTSLFSQIDIQLVAKFLDSNAAGYYSNYLSLIAIPFIFLGPMISFLFPVISELSGRKDHTRIRIVYSTFSLYFSIFGIWIGMFFLLTGPSLAVGFFSEKFLESGYILLYSAPFVVFNLLIQLQFQILAWLGRARAKMISLILILPVNILLNLLFILVLDMWARGSALAVWLTWVPLYLIGRYYIRDCISPIDKRMLFANLSGAVGTWILLYYTIGYYVLQDRWDHLLYILFAILLSFCIFLAINYRLITEFIRSFRSGLV